MLGDVRLRGVSLGVIVANFHFPQETMVVSKQNIEASFFVSFCDYLYAKTTTIITRRKSRKFNKLHVDFVSSQAYGQIRLFLFKKLLR